MIWGEKQKARSRKRKEGGGHMCHPTAAIEVSSVSFRVCCEQVWEREFVNACYQGGRWKWAGNKYSHQRPCRIVGRQGADRMLHHFLSFWICPLTPLPARLPLSPWRGLAQHESTVTKRNTQDIAVTWPAYFTLTHTHTATVCQPERFTWVCVYHIIHRVRKHQRCTVSKPVIHIFTAWFTGIKDVRPVTLNLSKHSTWLHTASV